MAEQLNDFIKNESKGLGLVTAVSPANIAFIKYWGKSDKQQQWPANSSLSMTLSKSVTKTSFAMNNTGFDQFIFNNQLLTSKDQRDHKVFRHLQFLRDAMTSSGMEISQKFFTIKSENTFPMGCGIASSASGFAALTTGFLAACTDSYQMEQLELAGFNRTTIAKLALRGSGSAGRSISGGYIEWVKSTSPECQSIEPFMAAKEWDLSDIIIIASDKEKAVSSTDAHQYAWGSPLFSMRLSQIDEKLKFAKEALETRDLQKLGLLLEQEALEMHAVALTGSTPVQYFNQKTIEIISWIRAERLKGNLNAWFTLDAGPNIHLICKASESKNIVKKIQLDWPQQMIIEDRVGTGTQVYKYGEIYD
ncbi:MAG: diphosphomevalonate decarboxylase [Proteobacteria bacterium]|nr:diphosphomevalonate decarboxylase [Pseudomonadota bacterium]